MVGGLPVQVLARAGCEVFWADLAEQDGDPVLDEAEAIFFNDAEAVYSHEGLDEVLEVQLEWAQARFWQAFEQPKADVDWEDWSTWGRLQQLQDDYVALCRSQCVTVELCELCVETARLTVSAPEVLGLPRSCGSRRRAPERTRW